jgi:Enoyl-CoA hydratase/isomerase
VLAGPTLSDFVDVAVTDDSHLEKLVSIVEQFPQASVSLVLLLRGADRRTISDGLVAESTTYSMLQGGPEFARWREGRSPRRREPDVGPNVRVERQGSELAIWLSRAHVHNALSAALLDELVGALNIALGDPTLTRVILRGDGPSFSSGGDLDEFGSFPDPVAAHLIRLQRSVGRLVTLLGTRVEAQIHGACMGGGIEIPAFAHRVVAAPNCRVALPELGLGLIPGAGGTVSITRRIGRHRAAQLAFSDQPIDAETALSWGLVDSIEEN